MIQIESGEVSSYCSILMADDDRDFCLALRDVLETQQHQVEIVHSASEALDACARQPYDVLLLDINLPDYSGLDIIPRLELMRPGLDILIITGNASYDNAVGSISRSTIGYLTKPLDLDRLLDIHGRIAERKLLARENQRLQETIRRAKRQWESTFDAISDPIVVVDAQGVIQRINRAFCQRFGTTFREAAGASAEALILGSGPEPGGEAGRLTRLPKGPGTEQRDNLAVPGVFEVSCDPVELGSEIALIYVLRDVTGSKRAAAERDALIRQLEEKNTELEQYTYTVSHDLKGPLTTITGFLGLLHHDVMAGDTERMKSDIDHIANAADQMGRLLEELLQLSSIGRFVNPPQDVPLAVVAQEAVDLLTGPPGERVTDIRIAADLPVVRGDHLRLMEVFLNLLQNAVKFMGKQPRPRIEVGVRYDGGETVCYVRDNGIGIDPRGRDKIFGLFEQLDRSRRGTGIGLALVKRIVEVYGGRIWVESEGLGKGSCFCFTLPGDDETRNAPDP